MFIVHYIHIYMYISVRVYVHMYICIFTHTHVLSRFSRATFPAVGALAAETA